MTEEDAAEFRNLKLEIKNFNFVLKIVDIAHYTLAEQLKLPKVLERENCDLWHFLNFNVPVKFKGKYVVTIHDLTLFFYEGRQKKSFLNKLAYKYIFKSACQNAREIIAVSCATKQDIMQTFKIESKKIKVVHEAADDVKFSQTLKLTDEIAKIKKKYQLANSPVILYVGQWRHHKNLTGLIEAYELLRQESDAKLVIIGKVDPLFPEVLEAIDKSAFASDIIKTGFVSEEELAAWYKASTVFVFPSFYEGFGLPGLEAMAAGLAVVSSDRTSLPEIYGSAAIYFNPSDPQDMKNKIQKVIADPVLREKMIADGHKMAQKYSWAKTSQETLEIYNKIINK
jgi:glycosyltransferase involved in cell wall biosynthesis